MEGFLSWQLPPRTKFKLCYMKMPWNIKFLRKTIRWYFYDRNTLLLLYSSTRLRISIYINSKIYYLKMKFKSCQRLDALYVNLLNFEWGIWLSVCCEHFSSLILLKIKISTQTCLKIYKHLVLHTHQLCFSLLVSKVVNCL